MNGLILISVVLSVLAGLLRGADLLWWTDAGSGLCTVGSVWWRYAVLGIAVLAAVLIGRHSAGNAQILQHHSTPAAAAAFAGSFFMSAAGIFRLFFARTGAAAVVRAVLELLCLFWFAALARSWNRKEQWRTPAGGLYAAVAGSALFYWNVLMGFMENSSSWQRVQPTAEVWQMLAALLFLSALARTLYLPEPGNGKTLCAAGLAAFCLCLCWELPHTVQLTVQAAGWDAVPGISASLGLCCIGMLGVVCAAECTAKKV